MTDSNNVGGGSAEAEENSNSNSRNPASRWRFDIDLNFDPSWLVHQTGSGRQITPALNMLNDWMRAPYSFRRSNSENNDTRPRNPGTFNTVPSSTSPRTRTSNALNRGASQSANTSLISPTSETLPSGSSTDQLVTQTVTNVIQGYLQSAGNRVRTPYQNIEIDSTVQGAPRSNPESYVVDMESDNWSVPSSSHHLQVVHSHNHSHSYDHDHGSDDERERRLPGESPRTEQEQSTTTPAEMFRNSPEGQAIISVAERYSPFLLILLIKGLFDHGSGIVCFLALLLTFSHANSMFKKEVCKQNKRKLSYLLMITANLLVCIGLIFYVYQDEKLYLGLLFLPTQTLLTSMWTMFWVTGVVDFVAKYITIIVKVFVLSCPARVCPYQKRGKYYLFVERTSQLYRTSIPMYSWVLYMSGTYEGPSAFVGGILALLYVALKLSDISKRYRVWRIALTKMLQQVHYGITPNDTEMKDAGEVCPICHDAFQDPTKLNCNHIFCEECVTTWFDRERTCPMCRARVVDDPSYRDGQTTHFIQIF